MVIWALRRNQSKEDRKFTTYLTNRVLGEFMIRDKKVSFFLTSVQKIVSSLSNSLRRNCATEGGGMKCVKSVFRKFWLFNPFRTFLQFRKREFQIRFRWFFGGCLAPISPPDWANGLEFWTWIQCSVWIWFIWGFQLFTLNHPPYLGSFHRVKATPF